MLVLSKRPVLFGALAALLALSPLPVGAQVTEEVDYRSYAAEQHPGIPLLQALDAASPIRVNGQTFHAYTAWVIQWRFSWQQAPDGRCAITRSETRLLAAITLPALVATEGQIQQTFSDYLAALRHHEEGHVQIARATAAAIDLGILSLPAQDSCPPLETLANQLAERHLEDARRSEREYDRTTGYGHTQGAWLPR